MNDLASGKDMLRAPANIPVLIVSSLWQCLIYPNGSENNHDLMGKWEQGAGQC